MFPRQFIFTLLYVLSTTLQAQENIIDSKVEAWQASVNEFNCTAIGDSCNHYLQSNKLKAIQRSDLISLLATSKAHCKEFQQALSLNQRALKLRIASLPPNHPKIGFSYLNIGNVLIELNHLEEAETALLKAKTQLLKKHPPYDTTLYPVYSSLGELYSVQNIHTKANNYWQLALNIARKKWIPGSPNWVNAHFNFASAHQQQGNVDSARILLTNCLDALDLHKPWNAESIIRIQNSLATIQSSEGYQLQAIDTWEKAIQHQQKNLDYVPEWLAGDLYYNLGALYMQLGNWFAADLYLHSALSLYNRDPYSRSRVWNALGLLERYRHKPQSARAFFTEALNDLFAVYGEYAPPQELAAVYQSLSDCYEDDKDSRGRLFYLKKAEKEWEKLPTRQFKLASCQLEIAKYYQKSGDAAMANYYLVESNKKVTGQDKLHRYILAYKKGELAKMQSNFTDAIRLFRRALDCLKENGPIDAPVFPFESALAHARISECLWAQVQRNGSRKLTKDLLNHIEMARTMVDMLWEVQWQESLLPENQSLLENIYGIALSAAISLDRKEEALHYSMHYKAYGNKILNRLLVPANGRNATELFIAQQRLSYLKQIKYEQEGYSSRVLASVDYSVDDSIRLWTERIRLLKREGKNSKATEKAGLLRLTEIQSKLRPNETLLKYHLAGSKIFIFLLTRDELLVREILDSDSLLQHCRDFIHGISTPPTWQNDSMLERTTELGNMLYDSLIRPYEKHLKKNLKIIPDGLLYYLPFEALIQKAGEKSHRFNTHLYLVDSYDIGYNHSIPKAINKEKALLNYRKNKLLAIAPVYEPGGRYTELKYNMDECRKAIEIMGGKLLEGSEASINTFREYAVNYQAVLISSHGFLNDNNPAFSHLVFSQPAPDSSDNILYINGIYSMKLPIDLLVLSACETNSGATNKGYGIAGMAWAFQAIGVKTVVSSFWAVDDRQAPILIEEFFKQYKNGKKKFQALSEAKRSFLRQRRGKVAHPYYWAGFAAFGDNSASGQNTSGWWSYILAIAVISILIFIVLKARKRKG